MTAITLSFPTLNCLDIAEGVAEFRPSVLHPLETILRAISASGVTHVGIDQCSMDDYLNQCGDLGSLRKLLSQLRLVCSDVGVLRISDPERSFTSAARFAEMAGALGAKICVTTMAIDPSREAIATLRACADVLADAGACIALEFLPYSPLPTLRMATEVCAAVGWDRCGLLVDTWMFFRGDNEWSNLESLGPEQIRFIQFNDGVEPTSNDIVFEARHRRVTPGNGMFPLSEFATAVLKIGFAGIVSIEILSKEFRALEPLDQGRRALGSAIRYWDRARNGERSGGRERALALRNAPRSVDER